MYTQKFTYLLSVRQMLLRLLGTEDLVDIWWKSDNSAFDFGTPEEMWEKDPIRVMGYIEGQFK